MKEENKQAVEDGNVNPSEAEGFETAEIDSATIEDTQSEEVSTETEEADATVKAEAGEELTDDDIKHLSQRTQKRLRRLADENKRLRELNGVGLDGLNRQIAPEVRTQGPNERLPWDTDAEITVDDYEQAVVSKADAIAQARIAQYEARQQLREDVLVAQRNYPELDPNSGAYDEVLAEKVSAHFQRVQKADPSMRLVDFVEDIMSIRDEAREQGRATTTAKVVEQAAQQAISPTGEGVSSKVTETEALFETAKEIGSDDAWAAYFKRTSPIPQ